MSILFAGGEMGAFVPADGDTYETTSAGYDTSLARCAIRIYGFSGSYAESAHWSNATDFWFHADLTVDTAVSGSEATYLSFYDSSNTEVYKLTMTFSSNALTVKQYRNNAGSFVQVGSSFTTSTDTRNTLDIHFTCAVSGEASVYLSGTQRLTGTADTSALNGVAYVRLKSNLISYWSQVICADESTVSKRLKTVPPTGAGATTDWTGTYTEIDETVYSDTDFINSATVNQVELVSHGTTIPSGYVVDAFVVTARAKCGATGPQNLQLAVKSGATTYTSSSIALDAGYTANVAIWETDPATSAAFTSSAIASLQYGVKSIT
jgi:hypothetical protein